MFPRIKNMGLAGLLALAVSLLGLGLRVEHALTFDGPGRGADYAVNVYGVRWTIAHWAPFNFDPALSNQLKYQPPLWFVLGGLLLKWTHHERSIAFLAVFGWLLRQILLASMLKRAIPKHPWSSLAALSVHAILPISVLTDGKVNPEGLHTTMFMVAIYALWRIEQELSRTRTVPLTASIAFGTFAGLAVLTKATGGVLPMVAAIVFAWRALAVRHDSDRLEVWRQLVRSSVAAGLSWCAVAGFWCFPNLVKYHHPFPHIWNFTDHSSTPVLFRRPPGWFFPFEWRQYLTFPIIYTENEPVANFWATSIAGIWSDIYNRGFCRLRGGDMATRVFGVNWGPSYGAKWWMPMRCVHLHAHLFWIGIPITILAIFATVYMAHQNLRTRGGQGTLVLPVASALVTFFVMMFALVYPLDDNVVLNPRYLLPATAPMSACLGFMLATLRVTPAQRAALHVVTLLLIAAAGTLLVYERFGS